MHGRHGALTWLRCGTGMVQPCRISGRESDLTLRAWHLSPPLDPRHLLPPPQRPPALSLPPHLQREQLLVVRLGRDGADDSLEFRLGLFTRRHAAGKQLDIGADLDEVWNRCGGSVGEVWGKAYLSEGDGDRGEGALAKLV